MVCSPLQVSKNHILLLFICIMQALISFSAMTLHSGEKPIFQCPDFLSDHRKYFTFDNTNMIICRIQRTHKYLTNENLSLALYYIYTSYLILQHKFSCTADSILLLGMHLQNVRMKIDDKADTDFTISDIKPKGVIKSMCIKIIIKYTHHDFTRSTTLIWV